jgi:hypothetical protein
MAVGAAVKGTVAIMKVLSKLVRRHGIKKGALKAKKLGFKQKHISEAVKDEMLMQRVRARAARRIGPPDYSPNQGRGLLVGRQKFGLDK